MRSRPVPPDLIVRPLELSPHRVATVWSITHDPAYFADKVVAVRTTGFFLQGRVGSPHLLFHTAVEARVWLEKARLQLAWLSPETLVLEAQDQATDRQLEAFDGEYVTVTGQVRARGEAPPSSTRDGVDTSASPILEVTSITRADAPPIASAWASGVDTPPPSASSAR